MTRGSVKAIAGIGLVAVLLAACSDGGGETGGDGGTGDSTADSMREWDACEVLGDLEPLSEFMGIQGWAGTASPEAPTSAAYGEGWDAEGLMCFGGIDLAVFDNTNLTGEVRLSIIPEAHEAAAESVFETRMATAEGMGGEEELGRSELADPWDQGTAVSSTNGSTDYFNAVARDGQWLVHLYMTYTGDPGTWGSRNEPVYPFDSESLRAWIADTYFPAVNHAVNDKIAEGADA